MSARFLAVPYAVIDGFSGPDLLLCVELYRRAHLLRWEPFRVTERELCRRFSIGNRRLRSVLSRLADLGLAVVTDGQKRRATMIRITCPTSEAPRFDTGSEQQKRSKTNSKTTAKTQQNQQQTQQQTEQQTQQQRQQQNGPALTLGSADPDSKPSSKPSSKPDSKLSSKLSSKSAAKQQQTEQQKCSNLKRLRPEKERLRENTLSKGVAVPRWLSRWLQGDGRPVRATATPGATLEAVTVCLNAIRSTDKRPDQIVESAARPVLRLWREMAIDDSAALPDLVAGVVLLAEACQHCPDPVFARAVRGEGWEGSRNRARNVAAVCRLRPPETSQGATWQERIEVARQWEADGKPLTLARPPAPGAAGDPYLARLNSIVTGEA